MRFGPIERASKRVSNPDRFVLEAVMLVEFQILSLRIQVKEWMPEEASELVRLQQLLALGEG